MQGRRLYNKPRIMTFINITEEALHIINPPMYAWVFGYLGWIIYNIHLLNKAEKEFDIDQDGYSIDEVKKYLKKNSVGILLSFLLVIVGVVGMPWLWLLFTEKDFHPMVYFLAGFMAIGLQKLLENAEKV